jgi:uridine kinase/Gpi18-like mannosyltransferase
MPRFEPMPSLKPVKTGSRQIYVYSLFIIGLVVKLVLSITVLSDVMSQLFMPFVNYLTSRDHYMLDVMSQLFMPFVNWFIENKFANPYEHFVFDTGIDYHFPYPAGMLYIISAPQLLFGWISQNAHFHQFLFKIPSIVSDFFILIILSKLLAKKHTVKLLVLYWLSPITIFIICIHGQLDSIPILFLLLAIKLINEDKHYNSAIILGIAIACKTNIFLAGPLFILFLLRKNVQILKIGAFVIVSIISFFMISFPFVSLSYLNIVFLNLEANKFFVTLQGYNIYIVVFVEFFLFAKAINYKYHTLDSLAVFLGLCFATILLLCIPPSPGWYFWILPFFAYFYSKEGGSFHKQNGIFLFIALQVFYILFFIDTKIFIWSNLEFTLLETVLLMNCLYIYNTRLTKNRYKFTQKPFIVGISGTSGSGKSTMSNNIVTILGNQNAGIVCGDDMHKWERGNEHWQHITALHPKANFLYRNVYDLQMLKANNVIERAAYNHDTGKFDSPRNFLPKSIIIFEGLHTFYLSLLRDICDLKIFLSPDLDLVKHRKIIRDVKERGHSKEQVEESIKK